MTAEKYVFYVSVPTIKNPKKENYQIYIFFKQYIQTHKEKVVFYPNDFIQTNKESPKKASEKFLNKIK